MSLRSADEEDPILHLLSPSTHTPSSASATSSAPYNSSSSSSAFGRLRAATLRLTYRSALLIAFLTFLLVSLVVSTITLAALYATSASSSTSSSSFMGQEYGCPFVDDITVTADSAFLALTHQRIRSKFFDSRSLVVRGIMPANNSIPLIFLAGGSSSLRSLTDTEEEFRQESNFLYLMGADSLPDCYAILVPTTKKSILLVPRQGSYWELWKGTVDTPETLAVRYGVDQVVYTDQLYTFLTNVTLELGGQSPADATLFVLPSLAAEFGDVYQKLVNLSFVVNGQSQFLLGAVQDNRAIKTAEEMKLLEISSNVTANAHTRVMSYTASAFRSHKLGSMHEFNVEAEFEFACSACDMPVQSYLPIVGSGYNGAVLHYTENDDRLVDGQILLIDAAGEFKGYASDVTRTWPVNGRFSERQRLVYEIVLDAQVAAIDAAGVGVRWSTLESIAVGRICEGLLKNGFLNREVISNCTVLTSSVRSVVRVFFAHGLGHFVGLDVHDPMVLGPNGTLIEGHVFTIEPGIYFNNASFRDAKAVASLNVSINWEVVDTYLNEAFGGVRIEDVVAIVADGSGNEEDEEEVHHRHHQGNVDVEIQTPNHVFNNNKYIDDDEAALKKAQTEEQDQDEKLIKKEMKKKQMKQGWKKVVLSAAAPKTVDDIESFMKRSHS